MRRHWLVIVGGSSLVGVVIAVDPSKLGSSLERANPLPLALMFPVVVSEYAVRGLGWHVLLRHLQVPVRRFDAIRAEIAGQSLIFLPAGDLGRVMLVRQTVPRASDAGGIAASIVVDELLFMTILGLAAIPAAIRHPELIGAAVALVGLFCCTVGVLLWRRAFERALGGLDRFKVMRRHETTIRSLRTGVLQLARPGPLLRSAGWNALGAGLGFLLFELAMRTVGITGVSPAEAALMYAAGHLLAAASMLPGGLGSYEGIVTGFMVLEGVPAYTGAAAALLYRGFSDLFMAGLGLAVGAGLRRSAGHPSQRGARASRGDPSRRGDPPGGVQPVMQGGQAPNGDDGADESGEQTPVVGHQRRHPESEGGRTQYTDRPGPRVEASEAGERAENQGAEQADRGHRTRVADETDATLAEQHHVRRDECGDQDGGHSVGPSQSHHFTSNPARQAARLRL